MSVHAVILGSLQRKPAERTGRDSGKRFVVCSIRTAVDGGESLFVNGICFSDSACRALLALDAGDSVAVCGSLRVGMWTPPDGRDPRPSIDMTIANVLTPYALGKKRKHVGDAAGAGQASITGSSPTSSEPPLDDFDDGRPW